MRPLVAALLLSPLFVGGRAAEAHAQGPVLTQPIDSGSLVRMRLDAGVSVRGRLLVPFGPDSQRLVFCRYPGNPCADSAAAGHRVQPTSGILQLEVGAGSRATQDAIIGSLAGLGTALLGSALARGLCDSALCGGPPVLLLTIGGALWGALLGSTDIVWRAAP